MSARELTIFVPESALNEGLLNIFVRELSLVEDSIPSALGLSFDFSAQKGSGRSHIAIVYKRDDSTLIHELLEWERPKDSYRKVLAMCKSSVSLCYRDLDMAKDAVLKIGAHLNADCRSNCIVDNGFGCLIRFDDILACIAQKAQWSWEKEQFPELPDVADSEWA